jgi:redox-sensitive bicupin YhaK (pirin superfamily)
MLTIRRSDERGHAKIDWLESRHSFSFGDYYDPAFESFGPPTRTIAAAAAPSAPARSSA